MAASVPSWMADVKEDTTKTSEWNELQKHIYDAVDQHLSQSHVSYFTDLTEAEKSLLLERAARSLASSDGGRVYENLQSKLSYLLDQTVNNQVAKKMLEDNPADTKTDLVLDTTSEGVVTLLRKHPEQKYKLRVFLNQIIPTPIRFLAWQLYFSNQNHRKTFMNKLTADPKYCLSPQDTEIQRKIESILNSTFIFKDLRYNKGSLNSIKGILSYYHTTLSKKRNLSESEYLYSVPIVCSHHPPLPVNERPTEKSMAILIEIFLEFIATLPIALAQSINGQNDSSEIDSLVKTCINILKEYDKPLLDFIKKLSSKQSIPGIEEITFQTAFKSFSMPMMKNLFCGYLNLESLLFVFDQYVIGSDVTGYHEELIPIVASIILMIIRDQLMAAKSLGEFDDCLKNQSSYIQSRQIQTILNKYFFKSLQSKLNSSTQFGPVIDPTAGRLQPWEHWHQDVVPRRFIKNKEPDDMDERLRAEVSKRLQAEKAAQEEIERLRRELENMKNQPRIIYKAPSPIPQPEIKPKPAPKQSKIEPISKQPVLDILKKLRDSVDFVSHSDGEKKKELDAMTSEDLRYHRIDLKIAEKEVFGRNLKPRDWDSMSEDEKNQNSVKMLEIVKKRLQERFLETGRF